MKRIDLLKTVLRLFAALIFLPAAVWPQESESRPGTPPLAAPAVPHYAMDLAVDPVEGTISGRMTVSIPPEARTGDSAFFQLMLNLCEERNPRVSPLFDPSGPHGAQASSARISNVTVNGTPTEGRYPTFAEPLIQAYSEEHFIFEIPLPVSSGSTILEFDYLAQLPETVSFDDAHLADRMLSRFSWLPVLSSPDRLDAYECRFFTYEARVRLPEGWRMVAGGTSFSQTGASVETASTAPVGSFPLAFLRDFLCYETPIENGAKTLRVYYQAGREGIARLIASYAEDALRYYAETYFPLDTRNISIVQHVPGGFGMAADSVVFVGDALFTGLDRYAPGVMDRQLDFLLAHEIGHFYFGIGTPPDFLRENYLSEGLNQDSSYRYFESRYGVWNSLFETDQPDLFASVYAELMRQLSGNSLRANSIAASYMSWLSEWNYPMSSEPEGQIDNGRMSVDYYRSQLVLSMLASYVGEDRFDEALRAYLIENRYRNVDTRTLQRSLEDFYGRDLDGFFNAYVYAVNDPDYRLTGVLNERTETGTYRSVLEVSDAAASPVFVPSLLRVFLSDGTTADYPVAAPGETTIETSVPVRYAGVDPDAGLMDNDRRNNFFPRQTVPSWSDEGHLMTGEATQVSPAVYVGMSNTELEAGAGLAFTNPLRGSLSLVPFFGLDLDPNDAESPAPFGVNLAGTLLLPLNSMLGFTLRYEYPSSLAVAAVDGQFNVYAPASWSGTRSRTDAPILSLRANGGVRDLDFAAPNASTLFLDTSVNFIGLNRIGFDASVGNELLYHLDGASAEDRVTARVDQAFLVFGRAVLGMGLSGSATLGSMDGLASTNALFSDGGSSNGVLPSTGAATPVSARYGASAHASLAFPLINGLNVGLGNLGVLQSINAELRYEARTAFDDAGGIVPNLRQGLAVAIVPTIRTLLDIPASFGIGAAWDLTSVASYLSTDPASRPEGVNPLIPSLYFDLGDFFRSLFTGRQAF